MQKPTLDVTIENNFEDAPISLKILIVVLQRENIQEKFCCVLQGMNNSSA